MSKLDEAAALMHYELDKFSGHILGPSQEARLRYAQEIVAGFPGWETSIVISDILPDVIFVKGHRKIVKAIK